MKKLRGSLTAKIAAIFLLTLSLLAMAASLGGILFLVAMDAYPNSLSRAQENLLNNIGISRTYRAADMFLCGVEPEHIYSDTNFCFAVYDPDGTLLYDGLDGEETIWETTISYYPSFTVSIAVKDDQEQSIAPVRDGDGLFFFDSEGTDGAPQDTEEYTIQGYILKSLPADDGIKIGLDVLSGLYNLRYHLIVFAVLAFVIWLLLFIFLLCAAGHRDATDVITPNFIDKLPFDLFTFVIGFVFCALFGFAFPMGDSVLEIAVAGVMLLAASFLGLLFCMSLATRLKLGGVIKSCLIYRALRWCWNLVKKFCRGLLAVFRALPLLGRWGLALAGVLVVEFLYICATPYSPGAQLFGWFVERAVLLVLLLYALSCMKRLQTGARELAGGNDSYKVDTRRMYGGFKKHAEDLNNIGAGINKAVNERMKSEHFRTELITNVSHDIKTPLTSIVNYVDLLSKEKPENEKMREYIDVLSRQSARLKKLIDDLIEASKASTGNLSVNMERCELGVLLDQTAGEYGERLSKAGLELVLTKPEQPVAILADGRHMWRVFDNLMGNACKYAQPGTRVYLSLEEREDKAVISFRNISRSQLNISGDELMERFVRGDTSRNTEGSGLGLSIARSLVQLQHGSMELIVDGDLFKVVLSFNKV